jgi:hypothetical protein
MIVSHLDGLEWLAYLSCTAALLPAVLFAVNFWLFRRPAPGGFAGLPKGRVPAPVSVLIPARNEELSIAAAIDSVLASRDVVLELIVLDDGSTDRTAELVLAAAARDARVRLETAPPLPAGWNGKQHACWVLASRAKHDVFCFLDADVRLGPDALWRMLSELERATASESRPGGKEIALVSGFPRQETGTWLEWLLLPLIHFVLLGFLPLAGERWTGKPGFAAGCGQFMMVRKEPYFASGGHSAIRTSMHDGLLLPQLFRRKGFQTHVYDLSRDVVCRMYRGAGQVWRGLAKNATEGMAAPSRILVFTVLLLAGQVLPLPLAVWAAVASDEVGLKLAIVALCAGYFVRIAGAARYRQSWRGALLHPAGVLVLLALQWYALARKLAGRPATWKQRAYRVG